MFPPAHLLLQWHVTEHCNLQCGHCYQQRPAPEDLPLDVLLTILQQFCALREEIITRRAGERTGFHITVTGGEPFVRPDFLALLRTLSSGRDKWSFAVLSNGTLIDDAVARELSALAPSFVQVSIDGSEPTHDSLRGAGAFAKAVTGIRCLVRRKVPVMLAFTATRHNYHEFSDVARLGRLLRVRRVWADRAVPLGGAGRDAVLDPVETRTFMELLRREASASGGRKGGTEIALHRALQFTAAGGQPYRCTAGNGLLTILANGDVCPCRRMPTVAGNLLSEQLGDVYWNSPVLARLRTFEGTPSGCEQCFYSHTCAGGLRCLSAAMHGDCFVRDPGCWLKTGELPPSGGTAQDLRYSNRPNEG